MIPPSATRTDPASATPVEGAAAPRVVTFVGAKGGCGTTLIAANLAGWAAATHKVGLADLDFHKGDVAGALDLSPDRTMNDLLADPARLDGDVARGCAVRHGSGVWVLAQPHDLALSLQVGVTEVTQLVGALRTAFEFSIIDAGSRMDEATASAAMRADLTVIVATPEVATLRDAGRVIDLLDGLGLGRDRIRLILNRWPSRGAPDPGDLASVLRVDVAALIRRDDINCEAAELAGRLIYEIAPKSELAMDLRDAWTRLVGLPPLPRPPPTWSLRRLLGSRS